MTRPLVSIVILSYNSRRYIEKCLDSVLRQDYPNIEILILINGSDDGSAEIIKSRYSRIKKIRILEPGANLWFSQGNNYVFPHAKGEYIMALNQDTILRSNFASLLVGAMETDVSLGSVTGKLLHYKFDIDSETRILDSTGIEIFKTRRVIDRGQWEMDSGQYDRDTDIFGASGAAAMYRKSALDQTRIPKTGGGGYEYFDEDFIAYKEDVDLAWRLRLAGYGCRYVPQAVIFHGRNVGRSWPTQFIRFILNRRRQSREIRKLSFKNHYLMMVKNEVPAVFWRHFGYILTREILLLLYTIIFEQFQIFAAIDFFKQLPRALQKRKYVMANVKISPHELRKLFH